MLNPDDPPVRQLASLATALKLPATGGEQDWGIELGESTRVSEFVAYFEEHHSASWSPWTVGEYVDLVLQSANDALEADQDLDLSGVHHFVSQAVQLAPDRVQYWSDLTSHDGPGDCWPISAWLRQLDH